jgi:hypothetical protein
MVFLTRYDIIWPYEGYIKRSWERNGIMDLEIPALQ